PRVRRCGRPDELRAQYYRCLPPDRRLCRTDSQRREAGRSPGDAVHQIRVRDQPQGCKGARPQYSRQAARARRRGDRMKRRDFITLVGGAAVAWPLAARAQQADRMRHIGVLMSGTIQADQPAAVAAFVQTLERLGWDEGRNVGIDIRWARGDPAQARRYAEELITLGSDVIMATAQVALGALLQTTRDVPIVFNTIADPVGAGYVDTLARPGGNATGFIMFEYSLAGKWLQLLKQIAPNVTRAAVLRDPSFAAGVGQFAV